MYLPSDLSSPARGPIFDGSAALAGLMVSVVGLSGGLKGLACAHP